jgi:hypothetical protein
VTGRPTLLVDVRVTNIWPLETPTIDQIEDALARSA